MRSLNLIDMNWDNSDSQCLSMVISRKLSEI
jgi:hypothetical protein